jgi:hypothetical protein
MKFLQRLEPRYMLPSQLQLKLEQCVVANKPILLTGHTPKVNGTEFKLLVKQNIVPELF